MKRDLRVLVAAGPLLLALSTAQPAFAQKAGGILKIGHFDSPASMSMLEESTAAVNRPVMGVLNNLVMYKQDVPQNSPQSIVPEIATGWTWDEEGTALTLPLRQGVKWHDGKPFNAADVKCTFDLLQGKASEKLRINPRKSWYDNLASVTNNGDYEVTFHLKRPQASFLAMLATGWSPIYPCHVPPAQMRLHPIGTGPFKFVEFKPNQSITVARNPDYWKPGRPYLDGIEWTVIKDVSTRLLAFISGKTDFYPAVTIPQLKDVTSQAPQAVCKTITANVNRNLLVNRNAPPFDNSDLRRAMTLTLDRKVFNDIINEGQGDIGGAMQPPPDGLWGMHSPRPRPGRSTRVLLSDFRRRQRSAWGGSCKSSINHAGVRDGCMPNDLDPERFTVRQAAQARDDFAMIMDELEFVKAHLARLPTRRIRRLSPSR